jgi:hypothetical protein
MFLIHTHTSATIVKSLLVLLIWAFLMLYWQDAWPEYRFDLPTAHPDETPTYFHPKLVGFWKSFAPALAQAKPHCAKITVTGRPNETETHFDPDQPNKPRPKYLEIAAADERALRASHLYMVEQARRRAPSLYFKRKTRGIVTTVSPKYMQILLTSLAVLRRVNSQLYVNSHSTPRVSSFVFKPLSDRRNVTQCYFI